MPSSLHRGVITSHEYLQRLLRTPPDRRFAGSSPEEFGAWRDEFLTWLRGLLYPDGNGADAPGVPEFEVSGEEEWHGCKRTELRFHNPVFDMVVPATVLEPPSGTRNGAGGRSAYRTVLRRRRLSGPFRGRSVRGRPHVRH